MSGSKDFFAKTGTGDSHPAVRFEEIGDHVKGVIVEDPNSVQRPNLNDGTLEDQLPVNIKVDGPTKARTKDGDITVDAGGTVTLWITDHGWLASTIKKAMIEAGVEGLAGGGNITVALVEKRPSGKPKPANIYKAAYTPPVSSGTSVEDLFPSKTVVS